MLTQKKRRFFPLETQKKDAFALFDKKLKIGTSFDMVKRPMIIGEHNAALYMVDGFVKDEIMEKIMEFLFSADPAQVDACPDAQSFANRFLSYVEVAAEDDPDKIITQVLSGTIALVMEQYPQVLMIDARTYPSRSVSEPEDDKVLRGSHDGFVEALVFNTALIRRRIRDVNLVNEIHTVGQKSKTDVVLCYIEEQADPKLVAKLQKLLDTLDVNALAMAQESLNEALVRSGWYNPFPKVRYTERPDTAAASILEGKVAIIVDNSPTVMLLPAAVFDFVQESNDYYFPPLVGTYLRFVRMLIFIVTIFLTPVWYLLIQNPSWIPPWLDFIKIAEPNTVPIIAQLLIFEIVIDGLKLASLNTPSSLSNSFSVVGALILGEFAVEARWFVPEVILYMALVAIGNFTQPSFELGYAFKLIRILLIVLTAIFNLWGFIAGILVMLVLLATNRTPAGTSYLYPLIPFKWSALSRLLIRRKMHRDNN